VRSPDRHRTPRHQVGRRPVRGHRRGRVRHPRVRIRRATSADTVALEQVFAGLSARSRQRRYLGVVEQLRPGLRRALLDVDDADHVLLVAEVGPRRAPVAVGLARYVVDGARRAELAYEVVDAWQGRGVGTRLLERLVRHARDAGITTVHGTLLRDNVASLRLLERVLPRVEVRDLGAELEVVAPLVAEPLVTAQPTAVLRSA
jgi:GNAT superfamily N-acetyltransferase